MIRQTRAVEALDAKLDLVLALLRPTPEPSTIALLAIVEVERAGPQGSHRERPLIMAEKESIGKAQAKTLNVKNGFSINGVAVTASAADLNVITGASGAGSGKSQGGFATITGTGTVVSTLATITSVVAVLGADAALTGTYVTATKSGLTITLKVWKPTSNADPTPIASTTAVQVNWIATGT